MKILITGAKGFIGTNLVKFLSAPIVDYMVTGTDIEELDVTKSKNFKEFTKTDWNTVVHLAAVSGHKDCNDDPERSQLVNVVGTHNVVRFCNEANARLIFASSCAVARAIKSEDFDSLYTSQKFQAESYIRGACKSFSIMRFANVYGPYSDHKNSVVHKFVRCALVGKKPEFISNEQRDFVYVDDVCSAIEKEARKSSRATSNLCSVESGTTCSVESLNCQIKKQIGSIYGRGETSLLEGIRKTVQYYIGKNP